MPDRTDADESLFAEFQTALYSTKSLKTLFAPLEDLSPGEGHVLRVLVQLAEGNEWVRPRDLAEKMDISPQALSPILAKLGDKGYVARRLSTTDRRVFYVEPTPKGRKASKKLTDISRERIRGVMDHLGPRDSKKFIALMSKVAAFTQATSVGGDDADHMTKRKRPYPRSQSAAKREKVATKQRRKDE